MTKMVHFADEREEIQSLILGRIDFLRTRGFHPPKEYADVLMKTIEETVETYGEQYRMIPTIKDIDRIITMVKANWRIYFDDENMEKLVLHCIKRFCATGVATCSSIEGHSAYVVSIATPRRELPYRLTTMCDSRYVWVK